MSIRRTLTTAAALVVALGIPAAPPPAHADSSSGYAIGVIVDAATGKPLPGANAAIYVQEPDGSWSAVDSDDADRNGRYVLATDTAGTYKLRASLGGYDVSFLGGGNDVDTAVGTIAISVGANAAVPTIGLAPAAAPSTPPEGTATGLVLDTTGAPVAGASIRVYDAASRKSVDWTNTDAGGRYYLYGGTDSDGATYGAAPGGSYKLSVSAFGQGIADTWLGGKTFETAAAVGTAPTSAAPPALPNVVVARTGVGTVTGTVTVPLAAGSYWSAQAELVSLNGDYAGYSSTDAAGSFSIDVAPGVYYVRAAGYNESIDATTKSQTGYAPFIGAYLGKKKGKAVYLPTQAKTIVVTPGGTVSGIHITLSRSLKNLVKPWISGKLKKNKTLTANPGVWNQGSGVTFSYAWKLGKKTLGTDPTLKLTRKTAKKAKRIRVVVTASDASVGGNYSTGDASYAVQYGPLVPGSSKSKPAGSEKPSLGSTGAKGDKGKK